MTGFKPKWHVVALMTFLTTLIAGAAAAQTTLRCESPDGRRHVCTFDGFGAVQFTRQTGRGVCVQNRSWGVIGNTIWVDGGCSADFTIVPSDNRARDGWNMRQGADSTARAKRTVTVVCESRDGQRHRCAADTLGQISIGRQLTRQNKCVEGRTWGYDSDAIWVDHGCRAEFLIADNGSTYRDRPSQAMSTVVCESDSSRRSYCRADTRFGVRLTREISSNNCVLNKTWGTDRNGVWVSDGCRAEFAMKTRL
jgi:hypothetical protein